MVVYTHDTLELQETEKRLQAKKELLRPKKKPKNKKSDKKDKRK